MNHMVLHPDKAKFMLITTRQKRKKYSIFSPPPPLTAKDKIIEEVQNHRVLGVYLTTIWLGHHT